MDMIARHLARMTSGFGSVAVQIGSTTGRGLLHASEVPSVDHNGDPYLKTERYLLLDLATWPDVRSQQTATVDGAEIKIGAPQKSGDGRYWKVVLRG